MIRKAVFACVAAGAALTVGMAARSASAQTPEPAPTTLSLSFRADGAVTLKAQNVTVRQIFAEWARQCGCFVVNADRLTGAAYTIPVQFENESQGAVLASLLRQASGYLLTPKRAGSAGPSDYEVIYITPTSATSASAYTPVATMPAPIAAPLLTPGSVDGEIPPVTPAFGQRPPGVFPPTGAPPAPSPPPQSPTAGVFVPLVPITSSPAPPPPGAPQPGAPRTAPGMPTPALGVPGR